MDKGELGIEYTVSVNMEQFLNTQKIIQYGGTELFSQYAKNLSGILSNIWKTVVEQDYKYDSKNLPGLQTTAKFHTTFNKYREAIVNTTNLRDIQLRYMCNNNKCFKLPQIDCVDHLHRYNKIYHVSLALPAGIIPAEELKTWFYMTFPERYRIAFRSQSLDLKDTTMEEVTNFMQIQWK